MKKIFFLILLAGTAAHAQELFVYTEPASNMPMKSLGVRLGNMLMKEKGHDTYEYHMIPEIMVGANKHLMLHADAFISNISKSLKVEGGSFYAKYRLLSNDAVHSHFRMAAYGRFSFNNSDIHQEEIDLYGHNSGYQAGLVATQLLHKVALSANAGWTSVIGSSGSACSPRWPAASGPDPGRRRSRSPR